MTRGRSSANSSAGVLPGEHAQDRLERLATQLGVVLGAADQGVQLVHGPGPVDARGHDLLRQHVERVARHDGRLDGALVHQPGDDGALQQVAAVLGEDDALATARPTWWPARPTRCRPRATDSGDSTWMTRSTAPMSMPSSSELVATRAGRRPSLSISSMSRRCSRASEPWWARDQVLAGQLVELERQPLREPAAVGEDDGAAMGPDQLQDARIDRRPDARPLLSGRRPGRPVPPRAGWPRRAGPCPRRARRPGAPAACAPRIHDGHGPRRCTARWSPASRRVAAAQEGGHRGQRSLGGGQPDALGRSPRERRSAAPGRAPGGRRAWCPRGRGSRPR